jgi:hypothetical protein
MTKILVNSVLLLAFLTSVFGSDQHLYLDDDNAKVILEQTDKVDFEASTKPRVVEFYSPYCG